MLLAGVKDLWPELQDLSDYLRACAGSSLVITFCKLEAFVGATKPLSSHLVNIHDGHASCIGLKRRQVLKLAPRTWKISASQSDV